MQLSREEFRPSLAKHSVGRNNATSSAQILQSNNSLVRKKNVRLSPLTSIFSRKTEKYFLTQFEVFYGEKKVQFEIVRKWKSVWENTFVFLDFCKRLWKWVRLKNLSPFCLNPMRMKFWDDKARKISEKNVWHKNIWFDILYFLFFSFERIL